MQTDPKATADASLFVKPSIPPTCKATRRKFVDMMQPVEAPDAASPDAIDPNMPAVSASAAALGAVLREVAASGYRFTTPTPLTHQRLLARREYQEAGNWRDVFGWNMRFATPLLSASLLSSMRRAEVLQPAGALLRSTVRIASIDDDLFLHSAYPTTQENAVFLGPDTYRFARFIRQCLSSLPPDPPAAGPAGTGRRYRILDVGCGSGAGGLVAARALTRAGSCGAGDMEVVMNDINPLALCFTAVNAGLAGVPVVLAPGDALAAVDGMFDLIVSNPPYMDDGAQRAYRHGGARLGLALSVRIAAESLSRLAPGGKLLLYTGVAIIDGHDPFLEELLPLLRAARCEWSYAEIDPDVFGEELERPHYAHAERIAAVGLMVTSTRWRA